MYPGYPLLHISYAEPTLRLELVMQQQNIEKSSFITTFHSQVMNTLISPIRLVEGHAGWVIVIESVSQDNRGLRIQ
jgi:hypothetical protein